MGSNVTKNQHWVPKFYLDYFATPHTREKRVKQVTVIKNPLNFAERFTSATESICGKRYLYTPTNEDGTRDRRLDELFDKIETQGGDVWRELKRDTRIILDPNVRSFLAFFVAAMHLRNLKMVNLIHSAIDVRNKLYGTPTETELENLGNEVYNLRNAGKAFIQFFAKGIEKSTETFHSQKWVVITTAEDFFITSDRPVSISNKHGARGGPHTKGAVTVFPLMPRAVLVIGHDVEGGGQPIPMNKESALFANKLVHLGSMNFVITGRPPEDVVSELRKPQLTRNTSR